MNRNQFDTDVCTWSPQGRLFQVEYAMEAANQGSASVGITSKDYAVVAGIKRSPSELAEYQRKVFRIDKHLGIAIAGLTADARTLSRYMRGECVNHRFVFGSALPLSRLASSLASKHQECTQTYVRRPYGVGLLLAGYDKSGAHLYQTSPSGTCLEYHAQAIGARSQSARTYLERHLASFEAMDRDELIVQALLALAGCMEADKELSVDNVAIGIVGKDEAFRVIEGDDVAPLLEMMEERRVAAGAAAGGGAQEAKMEDDE